MAKLLIVEDQRNLRGSLCRGLSEEGFEVTAAADGDEGYHGAATQKFDAVVLDVMLPGRSGLQVVKDLRERGVAVPVLLLTARDTVDDRVRGLDCGADDYLIKPFAFAELVARLRALLRRHQADRETALRADTLELDRLARRVVRSGVEIELSKREFELLEFLLRHRNSTVSRSMINREVWREPDGVWTNVIDVCINSLRKKIGLPGEKPLICTLRGVGYALRDDV